MYVDPFWFGVLCTLGIELLVLVIGATYYGTKRRK